VALLATVALCVAPVLGTLVAPAAGADTAIRTESAMIPVASEPDGSPVSVDASLYEPATGTDHPAVLLAHGFGGSKDDLAGQAQDLARAGYVAVTWSARGFGRSTGRIHLDDPTYEVADARVLVSRLNSRPEVRRDVAGDPRVGVVGGSYGGALALMLGASDPRIDAVAASITWNDLADAFFPQDATTPRPVDSSPPTAESAVSPAAVSRAATPGPFKQLWASRFFVGAVAVGRSVDPSCGRFDPVVCRLFLETSATGAASPELLTLLHAHSPKPMLADLKAPTLLVQGMHDSLFGLDQADATARTLATQGTPVSVRWMDGGHDGTSSTADSDTAAIRAWLDHYVGSSRKPAVGTPIPLPPFVFAQPLARRQTAATLSGADAPYVRAATSVSVPIDSAVKPLVNPPGAQPASVTLLPVSGALASTLPSYPLAALPGQSAAFDTTAIPQGLTIVGSPRVRLLVRSSGTSSTLFLSLWQVTGGSVTLPRQLVAPVTVATTPGQAVAVDVTLPAATWVVPQGSTLRVLVTSTDSTYAAPRASRTDQVAVSDLRLPEVASSPLPGQTGSGGSVDAETVGVLVAIGVVLLALAGSALWRRRRRRAVAVRRDLADTPLVVENLVKTYPDGHRAVDDVSWRAERGQVVGLLGPNGAGKTTTLRMVLGLIRADSGTVHLLGEQVSAGSPVLGRVGALVEGPGFLPHLTGRQNLEAYWAATGRNTADAAFDEVLAVAALGGAVDRVVRSYSQGMRQRLGIAQAMLGLPELLVLDEPTNGLDPPQIAGMRPILQRYAAGGRTVVVSSHLLSEVEMTCSHVVVMHAGRVVTTGTVADLVDSSDTTVFEVLSHDPFTRDGVPPGPPVDEGVAKLRATTGVTTVEVTDDGATTRLVTTSTLPRADVVRAATDAGLDVVGVSSRKHLEDVFLGVIAAATGGSSSDGEPDAGDSTSLTERLRQVRAR